MRQAEGLILHIEGQLCIPDEAEDARRRATRWKENAREHYNMANTCYHQGHKERALSLLNKAIELDPELAPAYLNRGSINDDLGYYDDAIRDYTRALDLQPGYVLALINRGLAYSHKGDDASCIADCNQALELTGNRDLRAQVYSNRGSAYLAKEEITRAIMDFKKALESDPSFIVAYFNLAVAYEHAGRIDEAIAVLSTFVQEASPEYRNYVDYAKQRIGEMRSR